MRLDRLVGARFPAGGEIGRFVRVAALALLAAAALLGPAAAQDAALKQRYDEAFKAFYANPSDLVAAAAYARLAVAFGDLEGAIGALERVALQAPNAEIYLELGRLYERLASYDAAASWYRKALDGELSVTDRAAATSELAAITQRQSPNQLAGTLLGGIAYQTNPNAGPTSISPALGAVFTARLGPKPDSKLFASANLIDRYDLGDQDGSALESRLALYGSRQFRLHTLNLLLAEFDTGPRMPLGDTRGGATIRPYVIGTVLGLGNSLYFAGPGIGTNVVAPVGPSLTVSGTFETRALAYHDFASEPTARDKDGVEVIGRGELSYVLDSAQSLTGSLQLIGYMARRDFESFRQLTVSAAYVRRFPAPWALTDTPWQLAFGGSRVWRPYGAANPSVDPSTTRSDREWNLSGTVLVPLTASTFVQAQLTQAWVSSSIPDYAYRDRTVSLALGFTF